MSWRWFYWGDPISFHTKIVKTSFKERISISRMDKSELLRWKLEETSGSWREVGRNVSSITVQTNQQWKMKRVKDFPTNGVLFWTNEHMQKKDYILPFWFICKITTMNYDLTCDQRTKKRKKTKDLRFHQKRYISQALISTLPKRDDVKTKNKWERRNSLLVRSAVTIMKKDTHCVK